MKNKKTSWRYDVVASGTIKRGDRFYRVTEVYYEDNIPVASNESATICGETKWELLWSLKECAKAVLRFILNGPVEEDDFTKYG